VLLKARNIGHTLQETGLFHYVNAALEPTRDLTAPAHDVDLVFKTKEKGRLQLKTSTEFGNQEGSAVRGIVCECDLISASKFLSECGGSPA
jgi:outer membrane protein insertion porin family